MTKYTDTELQAFLFRMNKGLKEMVENGELLDTQREQIMKRYEEKLLVERILDDI